MAPYPTRSEIEKIFHPLSQQGEQAHFFDSVADNVKWHVLGHSPMSRVYMSKKDFQDDTLSILRHEVLTEPLRLGVTHITGGGENEWASVELATIDAVCKNGLPYNVDSCWICRFNADHQIVEVRAYFDTELLVRALEQNT